MEYFACFVKCFRSAQCCSCAYVCVRVCLLVTWPTTVNVAARALRTFSRVARFVLTIHFANVVNVISESYKCFLIVYSIDEKSAQSEGERGREGNRMDAVSLSYFLGSFFFSYMRIQSHWQFSFCIQLILVFVREQMTYKVCDNRLFFPLQCWQYPLELSKHVRNHLFLLLLLLTNSIPS